MAFFCLSVVGKVDGLDGDKTKEGGRDDGDPLHVSQTEVAEVALTQKPAEVTQRWREQKEPEGEGRDAREGGQRGKE